MSKTEKKERGGETEEKKCSYPGCQNLGWARNKGKRGKWCRGHSKGGRVKERKEYQKSLVPAPKSKLKVSL